VDVRERARSFAGMAAYTYETLAMSPRGGDPPHVRLAAFVTSDFFDVLGVVPQMGRGFVAEEEGKADRGASVVVRDAFWRGSLAADPSVIGRTLYVAGRPFTIVGVTPPSFTGLEPYVTDSVFLPIGMLPHIAVGAARVGPDVLDTRDARILTIKGRL